jgi:hypothetical protein
MKQRKRGLIDRHIDRQTDRQTERQTLNKFTFGHTFTFIDGHTDAH